MSSSVSPNIWHGEMGRGGGGEVKVEDVVLHVWYSLYAPLTSADRESQMMSSLVVFMTSMRAACGHSDRSSKYDHVLTTQATPDDYQTAAVMQTWISLVVLLYSASL